MIWPGNPVGYFRQDRRHAFVRSQEIVEPVARVITSGWRAGHFTSPVLPESIRSAFASTTPETREINALVVE